MADEKDRLGDKLQNLEKAREDQWAAQRDRELLDKLQLRQSELKAAEKATEAACPRCHQPLVKSEKAGITMLACPADDGAWIEKSALDELLHRLG